jgi:hypothetical protein
MIGDNEYGRCNDNPQRTLTGKTMIDINDEMTVHNNELMIKSTTGC